MARTYSQTTSASSTTNNNPKRSLSCLKLLGFSLVITAVQCSGCTSGCSCAVVKWSLLPNAPTTLYHLSHASSSCRSAKVLMLLLPNPLHLIWTGLAEMYFWNCLKQPGSLGLWHVREQAHKQLDAAHAAGMHKRWWQPPAETMAEAVLSSDHSERCLFHRERIKCCRFM